MAETEVNIGIDAESRKIIAHGLSRLLADSYTLYLMTHNFHWNVKGPFFRDLHLMFEEQYTELAQAVDEIAERIRTLGVAAPGTYADFVRLSSIEEVAGVPKAEEMVQHLVNANEAVVRTAREILPSAQEVDDESTASVIADRMVVHEKTAWMLRSFLDN